VNDETDPGVRCPVSDPFWCSRDAGHPGAHVNRSATGKGMIGWASPERAVIQAALAFVQSRGLSRRDTEHALRAAVKSLGSGE
jgi:hypothetical protein